VNDETSADALPQEREIEPCDSASNCATRTEVCQASVASSQLQRQQIKFELEKKRLQFEFEMSQIEAKFNLEMADIEASEKFLAASTPYSLLNGSTVRSIRSSELMLRSKIKSKVARPQITFLCPNRQGQLAAEEIKSSMPAEHKNITHMDGLSNLRAEVKIYQQEVSLRCSPSNTSGREAKHLPLRRSPISFVSESR